MSDVSEYIKRAAKRSGFRREVFAEKNVPTQPSNVLAVPFFGDTRATFDLSAFFLRSYKERFPDKYIIMCSWPGMQGLFPYVDEYWTIEDESVIKSLATEANNIYNDSNLAAEITRGLAEVLDILTPRDIGSYYHNGFKEDYWKTFGQVRRFLPEVPSANKVSEEFKTTLGRKQGRKVIVFPSTKVMSWQQGRTVRLPAPREFWNSLVTRLLSEGYCPVVYQNWFTYDLSRDFTDSCIYLVARNVSDVLAAFRHVGCVLDVHSGISRTALAARTPYLSVTERQTYVGDRDYEVEDMCGDGLPKQRIYSFSTMLMAGGPEEWAVSLTDHLMVRLKSLLGSVDAARLPGTNETFEAAPYDRVRHIKAKRMGVTFLGTTKQR